MYRLIRKYLLTAAVLVFFTAGLHAQHLGSAEGITHLGVGIGLPYGGLGVKLGYNIAEQLTLFGGLGYNFDAAGFNGGLMFMFPSTKQTEFYLSGMYGYNGVLIYEDSHEYNETYYGPSFGAGVKINSRMKEGSFWQVSLILPVRSKEFIRSAANNIPVLFCVGYNFMLTPRQSGSGDE